MILDAIISKIRNYPTEQIVREAVNQNKEFAVDLNRQQMLEGKDAKGNPITPEYTAFTKAIKRRVGQPTDRVTLKFTGKMHREMFLEDQGDGYEFESQDVKSGDLQEKYGIDIFGHTELSEDKMSKQILPALQKGTKEYFTR